MSSKMKLASKVAPLLLISSLLLSLNTYAKGQQMGRGNQMMPPNVPRGSRMFNHTEMVPHGFMHSFQAGTPQVLRFRNMTMTFNASRNMSVNVTGDPRMRTTHFSLNLMMSKNLHLNITARGDPPMGVPRPRNSIERYMEIEPNTTIQMRATMQLHIDEEGLRREVNRTLRRDRLSWCYWNGTDWETVESWIDDQGYLTCETDHFSTWSVIELDEEPMDGDERPPMSWMRIGGVVVAIGAAVLFLTMRRGG